jgi:outer membrane receptor protein involved in Fe transport
LSAGETSTDQWSPKAGFNFEPFTGTVLHGAYSRFLSGVSLDQSVRLEPVHVAGFNQAYRSLIPEAVAGATAAPEFESFGLAWDQHFAATDTYLGVTAELLRSDVRRDLGSFSLLTAFPFPITPESTSQELEYEERNLTVTLNQLIGRDWAFNARYRLSDATLDSRFPGIPLTISPAAETRQEATLHEVGLGLVFNHPSGIFGSGEAIWYQQSNRGDTPDLPGDDFWQFNVFAGYRFLDRRAELRVGVLNLTDQDYRLNPLNLYSEMRRTRTFVAGVKIQF